MSIKPLLSLSYLVALWLFCACPALGQISDGLYKALPDSLKPKNKTALTLREKQRILTGAIDFYSNTNAEEFKTLAVFLDQAVKESDDLTFKSETLYSLGIYYIIVANDKKAIDYLKTAISEIGDSKNYNHTLAWCYSDLAAPYARVTKNNDLAIQYVHKSLLVEGAQKDSALLSQNYNVYSVLYTNLLQFEKAIYYGDLSVKFSPARTRSSINYAFNVLQLAVSYRTSFNNTHKRMYADSAKKIYRYILNTRKAFAPHLFANCYINLGYLYCDLGDYKEGLVMADSAILPAYNHAAYGVPNYSYHGYLIKARCLIKLGDFKQGKQILDTLRIGDLNVRASKYQALFDYSYAHQDWKNALIYYREYQSRRDSLDTKRQSAKMFEAEQKFNVAQKELTIAKLENENLIKEKEKKNLLAGGVLGFLALGALGYAINRRQRSRVRKEREELNNRLHKIEDEMHLQQAQVQVESEVAMADQRKSISRNMHDEVSTSLAALKYFVADVKNQYVGQEPITQSLEEIEQETDHVYVQARQFMHSLYNSSQQAQYNVVDFLNTLAVRFGEGSSLRIYTATDEEAIRQYFTPLHHNELYRIIKEAVTNTLKHSGANRLDISLDYRANLFTLRIADNGKGLSSVKNSEGIGLVSLSQRMALLKGHMTVNSAGTGTELLGTFPASLSEQESPART